MKSYRAITPARDEQRFLPAPLFMLARMARNLFQRPFVIGAMMLMAGYLEGYVRRSPMVADAELIRFVRRQQLRKLALMESVWR